MANILTKFITALYGDKVGVDEFGNIYYQHKSKTKNDKLCRWVIYKDKDDASNVPPLYHSWLHYTVDDFPKGNNNYKWQVSHKNNETKIKELSEKQSKATKSTDNYDSWQPNK